MGMRTWVPAVAFLAGSGLVAFAGAAGPDRSGLPSPTGQGPGAAADPAVKAKLDDLYQKCDDLWERNHQASAAGTRVEPTCAPAVGFCSGGSTLFLDSLNGVALVFRQDRGIVRVHPYNLRMNAFEPTQDMPLAWRGG